MLLGKPPRKPRELPKTRRPWCVESVAPSELVMRLSAPKAAASHATARSRAASGSMLQGCDKSRSGMSRARSCGSGNPAHSSSAVNPAMLKALATVSRIACGRKSPVLAEPLRWPRYTVMPMPRSRWYSSVSTSPSRDVTDDAADDGDLDDRPSKSARKRHSTDLQALGEELIELSASELEALPLP